jgi:hypothetical protein
MIRRSAILCSNIRTSHSWSNESKNVRVSKSSTSSPVSNQGWVM